MFYINRNLVQQFSENATNSVFNNAYNIIYKELESSILDIKGRIPYINGYEIYIANEALSETMHSGSSLDIFLEINAYQIELNSKQSASKMARFFARFQDFGKNFIQNFRLRKKKKKLNDKKIKKIEDKISGKSNYNAESLLKDLHLQLCKRLYNTTKIGMSGNSILVRGNDEFGVDINIYPIFVSNNKSVIYNIKTNKATNVDFKDRFYNFACFNESTNNMFEKQIKIFNCLFWNVFHQNANQIFIESILYNVPLDLYNEDQYLCAINIINYLKNSNLKYFISIVDNSNLFKDNLNTICLNTAYLFIKNIKAQ